MSEGASAARSDRPLGTFSLACLVAANMIGAGVYTTSGFALADLGTPGRVLTAWAVGGAIALAGALCYGGLARQLVASGGEYLFLSRAVHPLAGFLAGWISMLAGFTGALAYAALTLESYALPAGVRPAWLPVGGLATVAVLLGGAMHLGAVRPGAVVQNAAVVIKLLLLGGLILAGLAEAEFERLEAPPSAPLDAGALATALMFISFSYSGFNAAIYVAGEADRGAASVPRSMWLATLLVSGVYLTLNLVFLLVPPLSAVAGEKEIAAIAADAIGGAPLALATRGVIVLSLATSVSGMLLAGPRIYAQMAHDGLLPSPLAGRRGAPPRAAILLQVALVLLAVWSTSLPVLLGYTSFLLSISAAGAVACLLLPALRGRPTARPVPLWPWLPLMFILFSLSVCAWSLWRGVGGLLPGVAVLAAGVLAYFPCRYFFAPAGEDEIPHGGRECLTTPPTSPTDPSRPRS